MYVKYFIDFYFIVFGVCLDSAFALLRFGKIPSLFLSYKVHEISWNKKCTHSYYVKYKHYKSKATNP